MTMTTGPQIFLDVGEITSRDELHGKLASVFGFPSYYGRNWDAFWECLNSLEVAPQEIRIVGMEALQESMPRDAALFEQSLRDFQASEAGAAVVLELT
jgi:ribonuclease inhibitor